MQFLILFKTLTRTGFPGVCMQKCKPVRKRKRSTKKKKKKNFMFFGYRLDAHGGECETKHISVLSLPDIK